MAKYKIGDILNIAPFDSEKEILTRFQITGMNAKEYIGYYTIKGLKKEFSILLNINSIDNNSRFSLSLNELFKKL